MKEPMIKITITYFNNNVEEIIIPEDYLCYFVDRLVNCEIIIKVEIEEL